MPRYPKILQCKNKDTLFHNNHSTVTKHHQIHAGVIIRIVLYCTRVLSCSVVSDSS